MEFKGVRPWAALVLLIGFTVLLSSVAAIDSEGGNIASTGVENGVSVGIFPSENSALNGENLVFTVSVTNTDNEGHIFTLESSDVKNWQISLNKDNLSLDPDNSENVALTVSIPENAVGGMEDIITVAATAENDNTITGENSCTVSIESSIGFDLSITPSSSDGSRGDDLSFTANLQNTGNVTDSYNLNVIENAGWGDNVNLSNTNISDISPNEIDNVSLGITIPGWASFGSQTFSVVGVSENDNTVKDNASCTLDVEAPLGVQVSISPSDKSGEPGGSLSYEVVVKNTGGVSDNYQLSVSDNAGWDPTLENNLLEIPAGENKSTTLSVNIPLGTPSSTVDNLTLLAISQMDNEVSAENSCTAHVDPVRKVDVSIQPDNNAGLPGNTLNFTVIVTNTGSLSGGFGLSVPGDQEWQPGISHENFDISSGDSENATLSVTVPQGAVSGDSVTITVTATSSDNAGVSDSDSCTAMASISRGVYITELTPSENSGIPGENVSFSLRVRNIGELSDNYVLTVQNSWDYSISPDFLVLEGGKSGEATLTVTIPSDASPESTNQIIVTATSQEDQSVNASRSCIASSKAYLDVSANINPENRSGSRGDNLLYAVEILNTGNLPDNYDLTVVDDFGWDLSTSENSLENVQPGDNRNFTLTVKIPENAQADALDNVVVTATSQENENITVNASCVAYSLPITRSVEVLISPSEKEWIVGKSTSYTVTVKNTGDVPDNYILTFSDNAAWDASLSVESVEGVSPSENKTVSLNVTIPSATSPDTVDNITITATSQNDPSAYDSASCVGKALILKSVKVEVSSSFKSGRPGEEVVFEVIVTNTGQSDGNFNLTATATPGWNPRIEPSTLMLSSGQSDNAKLVVEIPSNIGENETGSLEARASLLEDSDITSADTCRVGVSGSLIGGGISLPGLWTIIWIIIIVAIIAVVIIVVRYLLGRGGQEKRSRVLSDLGGQKKKDRSRVLRELGS